MIQARSLRPRNALKHSRPASSAVCITFWLLSSVIGQQPDLPCRLAAAVHTAQGFALLEHGFHAGGEHEDVVDEAVFDVVVMLDAQPRGVVVDAQVVVHGAARIFAAEQRDDETFAQQRAQGVLDDFLHIGVICLTSRLM